MPRRKTVALNIPLVEEKIKIVFRRNVIFCEAMGVPGRSSWVSDWKRGKNLPSPKEAARMCAILQVEPEEILTEPSDIELVRSLIEQERGEEKKPPAQGGEPDKDELVRMVERVTNEATLRAVLNAVNKKFQELG